MIWADRRTSTVIPAVIRPPTARSSGTVIETARQAIESGAIVSPGSRIEKPVVPPPAVVLSRLLVTIWPWNSVIGNTWPMT